MSQEAFTVEGGDIEPMASTIEPMTGGGAAKGDVISNFFRHMLSFDYDTRSELLNITQYSLIGVLPIMGILKVIRHYFPEASPHKSTIELIIECVVELSVILVCIYFIDRFICYIPTYSGKAYSPLNLKNSILLFLVLLFTIQTKLGTKMNIILSRLGNEVNGYSDDTKDSSLVSPYIIDTIDKNESNIMNSLQNIVPKTVKSGLQNVEIMSGIGSKEPQVDIQPSMGSSMGSIY